VLAYCSQSRIISALTQRWILVKVCATPQCLSITNAATNLGDAFRQTAAVAGLSCFLEKSNWLDAFSNGFNPMKSAT